MSQKNSATPKTQDGDGIDLRRVTGVLIDHVWLIVAITTLFAFAGLIYALLATPIYRADALVQIEQPSKSNPLDDVTTLLGREPPSQSEIEIIGSRMVLGRAVDILNLDVLVEPVRLPIIGGFLNRIGIERPKFANGWGYTWAEEKIAVEALSVDKAYLGKTFTLTVLSPQRYELYYDGEKLGDGEVQVATDFLDGGVALTVETIEAPPGAKFAVSRISRLLATNNLKKNLSISERGMETGILNWGLTGPDPESAEVMLRTIADIYVAQNIQHQSEEARRSLTFLEGQLPAVRAELAAAEDQLNAYRIDRESVDLSLETQSVLERLVNLDVKLNELEFSEAEISRRFTPSHPTYAALLDKKSQLEKEHAGIESKIGNLPVTQQEILRLQRDASVNQQIYVQLRNKVQEMQIAEASTVGNVRVLDEAEGFPKPVQPNKKLVLVYATLFGGLVSVGVVMLLGLLKRGVETQDEIESLGLPVLATVPVSEEQEKINRRIKRGRGRKHSPPGGLLALRNPADTSIEALRGLRTSLHFGVTKGANNRLMIASPSPGAGKSFISANLAAVCAQAGQRVLIIDGDMRKGTINKVFGERSEDGLSEILAGRPLKNVVRSVEGIENLHYISRGIVPPNPSELLAAPRFASILELYSQRYDLVIIDSPPILAVTDAAIIGNLVETTLLVARFQLNPVKEIEQAIHRLERSGVKVTGAVLNALERTAANAYGYGYYNYSYR